MKIIVASEAGFCFGVKRALKIIEEEVEKGNTPLYVYGELIHNKVVVEDLKKRGVFSIDSLEKIEPGTTVVIRTHGISPQEEELLKKKNAKIVDTTCPLVKKAQLLVKRIYEEKRLPIIIGKPEHPEVKGEVGYGGPDAKVISSIDELSDDILKKSLGVIAQTTFNPEKFENIVDFIKKHSTNPLIYDTICYTTVMRQKDTIKLAKESDMMIILGGKHSSNTRTLYERAKKYQPKTYHIERAKDFSPELLEGVNILGISAGASTPDYEIKALVSKIEKHHDNVETVWREGYKWEN